MPCTCRISISLHPFVTATALNWRVACLEKCWTYALLHSLFGPNSVQHRTSTSTHIILSSRERISFPLIHCLYHSTCMYMCLSTVIVISSTVTVTVTVFPMKFVCLLYFLKEIWCTNVSTFSFPTESSSEVFWTVSSRSRRSSPFSPLIKTEDQGPSKEKEKDQDVF